jgi:uncharacterized protein YndB with AHSA1/START domain
MKWMLVIAVTIAAVVAFSALVGSRLPRSHRATRERTLGASPEAIWIAITDVEAFPSWRNDIKKAQRLPDRDGRPVWVEEGRSGRMTFAIERMEAPCLLVGRIADRDLPFGGTWTYELTPVAGGTRLRITEDGEIYNPLFRFMARFVFGYEGTIASYMAALEKRFVRDASDTRKH